LAEQAKDAVAKGFRTIKLKLGIGQEDDIAIVAAVREAVGPRARIRGDANGAWTMATAKRQLRALERYDLEYIEQPLPLEDLAGAAELRRQISTPLALDESVFTLGDVANAICQRAADVLVLDPLKAGGLLPVRKAAAVAEAAGIPVTLHSGGEAGVGLAACLHLAATFPNLLFDVDCQYPNLSTDIIAEPFTFAPYMAPPEGPGLGVELSRGMVHRLATDVISDPYLDPTKPEWFPCKPQY
jgi:glucarate dehydratase